MVETTEALLPGSRYGRQIRNRIFTVSIELTGRCNATCTYCHFFATRDRKEYAFDLSPSIFENYMKFIRFWKENIKGELSFRFSGGEPLVLGNKLFEYSNKAYEITGLKPFILSVGKSLNQEWVGKAKVNSISHLFVSIENPINPDKGAPPPIQTIEKIKKLNSLELPILAGVCVVPNNSFKDIKKICDWFYENLGYIPAIAEINYDVYVKPTEQEWSDLEENIYEVYKTYYGKTHLNLFHSVSPELSYQGDDPYLFSLDLENSYGITEVNYSEKVFEVIKNLEEINYPSLDCKNKNCDWWEFCDNTKWYWQGDNKNSKIDKIRDYCRFKRLLNDAFYKVVVDPSHTLNKTSIFDY